MHIARLRLTNYKNYASADVALTPGVNVIVGNNGMGKTNVLDAIYYLCLGRSYFSGQDRYVIKHEADFVRMHGDMHDHGDIDKMVIKLIPRKVKDLELNDKKIDRITDHLGRYLCIVISPIDVQLMLDGSEERRKYINNTIIQYDKQYVAALMTYTRLLKQRNALLKQMIDNRTWNSDLLDSFTVPMIEPARYVYEARDAFCNTVTQTHAHYYRLVSGNQEETALAYKSQLAQGDLREMLRASQDKDRVLGRTTVGVHKDDLVMTMAGQPIKFYGSQGQLKSYVLSLKLAQYQMLATQTGKMPILLLDDIFDKLDKHRVKQLLELVVGVDFGQVVITDTSAVLVGGILADLEVPYRLFDVVDGEISVARAEGE